VPEVPHRGREPGARPIVHQVAAEVSGAPLGHGLALLEATGRGTGLTLGGVGGACQAPRRLVPLVPAGREEVADRAAFYPDLHIGEPQDLAATVAFESVPATRWCSILPASEAHHV
jgi:hypothetical protein